jgi:hypothetical protein
MVKARVTSTDRLSNIVEVVELGRRSGLLAVERGAGQTFEEGEIYFVGGHPTFAVTGNLRGRDALAALGQWGACRFAFQPDVPPPVPNISGPLRAAPVPGDRGAVSQPGAPAPAARQGANSSQWGTPPRQPAYAAGAQGSQPGGSWSTSQLGGAWGASQPSGAWSASQPGSSGVSTVGPLGRRPRRAPDVRDLMVTVATHNLSRSHRTILLLADGSHNVLDLARLASKSVDEVTQLLAELEARGLVYYYE